MALPEPRARETHGARLPPAPPPRRLIAWLYTGPLGHLWSTLADVVGMWVRWGLSVARERLARGYSNR